MAYHHWVFSSLETRRDAHVTGTPGKFSRQDLDRSPKTIHLFDQGSGETGFVAAALRKAGFCVEVQKTAALLCKAIADPDTVAVLLDAPLLSESAVRELSRMRSRHRIIPLFVTSGDQTVLDRVRRLAEKTGCESLETIRAPFSARHITQRIAAKLGDPSGMLQQLDVLSAALSGWIQPVLQPRRNLNSGRIVSVELSTHMIHPEFGMIDNTTMMRHLDHEAAQTLFVHNIAFAQQHLFLGANRQKYPVAIRIDAAGLAALASELRLVADQTPGLREGVRLKTTETALSSLSGDQMQAVIRVGAPISLDAFNADRTTGPDRRLLVSEVTIDKAIVRGVSASDEQQKALGAALDRALALGARTVADGVDAPEDLAFLKTSGCDDAQGPLLGEPVNLEDFKATAR
jgi:EAL domain-containing protein (putative c-di-GMP-specific phosphodiesterase class I)